MKLIPDDEIKEIIPRLYSTKNQKDPIVYCKLFLDSWTCYIIELSIDENIAFGYVVSSYGRELGYFSLEELISLKGRLGIWVERDLYFVFTKFSLLK